MVKNDRPKIQKPIKPVKPNEKPGDVIERGENSSSVITPVKPRSKPGDAMPFGETKGGLNSKNN